MSDLPVVLARFPSQSQPGVAWWVTLHDGVLYCGLPDCPESACRGYRYHGHSCVHTRTVADDRARAAAEESRAAKSPTDRKDAWRHFADPPTRAGAIGRDQ